MHNISLLYYTMMAIKLLLTTTVLLWQAVCIASFQAHVAPCSSLQTRRRADDTRLYGVPLLGRFRKSKQVEQPSPPKQGEKLPDVDVEVLVRGEEGEVQGAPVSLLEVVGDNRRTVLVGMPGAFTPTCTKVHVPGYIKNKDKFQKLGIDRIAILTTNDRFVNEEWSEQLGLLQESDTGNIAVLCDADGDVVKEMGLAEDMGFGVGVRSKRFAMVTTNGTVEMLLTDDGMMDCDATSAESLIAVLDPKSVAQVSEVDPKTAIGAVGAAMALFAVVNYLMNSGVADTAGSSFM